MLRYRRFGAFVVTAAVLFAGAGCSLPRSDFPGAQGQVNQAARALAESIRSGEVIGSDVPLRQAATVLGLEIYGEGASVGDAPVLVAVNGPTSIDVQFGVSYRERLELWGEETRDYLFCIRLDYVDSDPRVTVDDATCPDGLSFGEIVSAERAGLRGGWSRPGA